MHRAFYFFLYYGIVSVPLDMKNEAIAFVVKLNMILLDGKRKWKAFFNNISPYG